MWDTLTLPARGNFSLRKIACSFLAVFVSAFLLTVLYSTAAHAADATWKEDGTVEYAGKIYQQETPIPEGMADIPEGSVVFLAKDEQQKTASALIIPANADQTKEIPGVAVINYTLTQDGGLTNAQRPPNDTITLTARPAPKNKTQCDVAGVGWIICTISRFIAGGMDNIFDLIANYLKVEPISTNSESGLRKAWSIALGIANLAFILAFLMIIYAHISSYGINNYNLKKMIPKLIVAAILVNLSYYICAIAVDLSNILGFSVQEALIEIRKSLPDAAGGSLDSFSWKNITEYILSGGTIVAGAFAAKAAFLGGVVGGSISGLTFLLFPILVAGALAVLIALVVLAARQALITVLIVIAPLAFVAYILPNTEKWFEKWRDLFMTMLMVFPLFSLLFGGSQLASAIVLQNTNQLSVALFAMFIQVAPLALTPFLVKFSGSLLGRLAGMINDPKRGIVDRARGWATDKAEVQGAKGIAAAQKGGGTFMQRAAYRRQLDKKNREGWKKTGESAVEAGWAWDSRSHRHHSAHHELDDVKKAGESVSTLHYARRRSTDANLRRYVAMQRLNEDLVKNEQLREEADWQEIKTMDYAKNPANQFAANAIMSEAAKQRAQSNMINDNAQAYRKGTAEAVQKIEYANAVVNVNDTSVARLAGGIDIEGGADSARAAAEAVLKKSRNDSIAEGRILSQAFNFSSADRQALALGRSVTVKNNQGQERTFTAADSKYVQLAAIEDQISNGTLEEALEIILQSGEGRNLYEHREIITDAMIKGGLPQKAVFLGGKTIDDVRAGRLQDTGDLMTAVMTAIGKGKLSTDTLLNQDRTSMETILAAIDMFNSGQMALDNVQSQSIRTELERLYASANTALTDPRANVRLGERTNAMIELVEMGRRGGVVAGGAGQPPVPPTPPDPDPDTDY